MEADLADAMLVLAAFIVGLSDPISCLAVRPTDGIGIFVQNVEARNLNKPL